MAVIPYEFHPEARIEVQESGRWYADRDLDTSDRFYEEVAAAIEGVATLPDTWPPYWQSLTLMFQKEVAERITAKPGTKAYGRLSILSQWRADPKMAFELPPSAFSPPPKVTSAVVHMERLEKPRFEADQKILSQVVARAFNQRRKMMRASLKGLMPDLELHLEAAGIDPKQRAETVTIEQFCALSNIVKNQRNS